MPKSELIIRIGENGQTEITQVKSNPNSNTNGNNASAPKPFKSMTWPERWQFIRELITVEPLLACYIIGLTLPGTAFNHLMFEKSCRVDAGYDDVICEAILTGNNENFLNETAQVHLNITNANSWIVPLTTIVPLILSLFWGSFSDRHQIRKPFLLMPIFGELLSGIGCILSVVFLRQWNLVTFLVITSFVSSFLGGQVLFIVALFAYIADVSTLEQRTLRVAAGQIVIQLSQIITTPLSGILFELIGYYGIFVCYLVFMVLGILYGIFCMKEKTRPRNLEDKKNLLLDLFDPRHIMDAFSILHVKKAGNKRLQIILIMIIFFINSGVAAGEGSIVLLYLNSTLGFTATMFSYLLTFNSLIHLKGNIIGVYLFTKVFNLTDYTIINIALLDKIFSNILIAVAASKLMIYIGVYTSLFTGITIIAIRSLATKVVCQEDLGKAQAFFGICEAVGAAAFIPIYNKLIYENTITTFPSAYFYAAIIFIGFCILLVLWMYGNHRKDLTREKNKVKLEGISNNAMVVTEAETSHM